MHKKTGILLTAIILECSKHILASPTKSDNSENGTNGLPYCDKILPPPPPPLVYTYPMYYATFYYPVMNIWPFYMFG